MACIVNDPNGRKRILFVGLDRRRWSIRLGKCDRRTAEVFCAHVEALLSAKMLGEAVHPVTAVWLQHIGPKLRKRLAVLGLAESEKRMPTDEFLKKWLEEKKASGY